MCKKYPNSPLFLKCAVLLPPLYPYVPNSNITPPSPRLMPPGVHKTPIAVKNNTTFLGDFWEVGVCIVFSFSVVIITDLNGELVRVEQ